MHLRFKSRLSALLLLGLSACQQVQSQPVQPTPSPLPQEERIQVYTNHEPASSYTEPYRQQTRSGDNLEQLIVDTIASARSRVDVAVQELRLPRVAQALVDRQKAGVKVRVILENTYSQPFSQVAAGEIEKQPDRDRDRYAEFRRLVDRNNDGQLSQDEIESGDALVMLDRAHIPRIDDKADGSAGSNLMHHKFVVVDGQTLIVTSANFTTSDVHGDFKQPASRGNANNLLKIDSSELAALFTEEFNLMWGDGPGGKPDSRFGAKKPFRPARSLTIGSTQVEVQFSPSAKAVDWNHTTNGLIGKTLGTAARSVSFALFVLSDPALVGSLEPAHERAEIRGLIDPGFAYRPYSGGLTLLGVSLTGDCKTGQPWKTPVTTIGVPRLPPGDLLHHKFGIVDQAIVITGSHNWTDAANSGNDETLLVIHSPIVAAHYQREFDRLYTNAILGVPPAIQKKTVQTRSCAPVQTRTAQATAPDRPASSPSPQPPAKPPTSAKPPVSAKLSASRRSPHSKPAVTDPVNLNTATQAELETLPGVKSALAKRIIAARQERPFTSLDDLDRVSGVGPKLLEKLRDRVIW